MVPPTPAALHDAVVALLDGRVQSVVTDQHRGDAARAQLLLDDGWCVVPASLLPAWRAFPRISTRERQVWEAVLAGQSNATIARALGVSIVTVKREIGALCAKAAAGSRVELWAEGVRLGLHPNALRP